MKTEKEYYQSKIKNKVKIPILTIQHFRQILYDYQPSTIWLDTFSEDIPYLTGHYADSKFIGSYTKQSLLTFDLNSLSELESVFKDGMYVYV